MMLLNELHRMLQKIMAYRADKKVRRVARDTIIIRAAASKLANDVATVRRRSLKAAAKPTT